MAWMRPITSSCSGGATSPSIPASSSGLCPARTAAAARRKRLGEALRVGGHARHGLVDQGEEVRPQPRDAGELAPVGDLVQGDPQPELLGGEAVAALEGHDVGADVGHDVARCRRPRPEQVVLAEDPRGHPAEDQAQLGPGGPRAAPASGPCRRPGLELLEDGLEQAPERRQVGPDPAGPVDHPAPGRAGGRVAGPVASITRASAWVVASAKSASSRGHGGGVERPGPGRGPNREPRVADPGGHAFGHVPRHGAGHGSQCREPRPTSAFSGDLLASQPGGARA